MDMPEKLLEQAASSIASGNGSPLLSDDDVVIPNLLRFGYDKADAFNYVVSACWEPLAWGCALEQNNMGCIQFGRCMSDMTADEKFVLCRSYEEVCALYFSYLKKELESLKNFWNGLIWEPDPLFTFFTEGCLRKGREIHAEEQSTIITGYSRWGFLQRSILYAYKRNGFRKRNFDSAADGPNSSGKL